MSRQCTMVKPKLGVVDEVLPVVERPADADVRASCPRRAGPPRRRAGTACRACRARRSRCPRCRGGRRSAPAPPGRAARCTARSGGRAMVWSPPRLSTGRPRRSISVRRPSLDLADRLVDVERVTGDVAGVDDLGVARTATRPAPGCRAAAAATPGGCAPARTGAGPVGDAAVERHADHGDVVVVDVLEPGQPREGRQPRVARHLHRVDLTDDPSSTHVLPTTAALPVVLCVMPSALVESPPLTWITWPTNAAELGVGQKRHRRGHLVGRADAAQRDVLARTWRASRPGRRPRRRRRPASCGVSVTPGATALTMMLSGASSRPRVLVSEISPALEAA